MTDTDIMEYLDTKDLTSAIWWYVENLGQCSSEVFFHLRERVRLWQATEKDAEAIKLLDGMLLMDALTWAVTNPDNCTLRVKKYLITRAARHRMCYGPSDLQSISQRDLDA